MVDSTQQLVCRQAGTQAKAWQAVKMAQQHYEHWQFGLLICEEYIS
jgi:hypothetical protein